MQTWRGDRKPEGERQREVPKEKRECRERKKEDKAFESKKNIKVGEDQRGVELSAQLSTEVLVAGRQTSLSVAHSLIAQHRY